MILTAAGIREARDRGDIELEPFDEGSLNPNTYDLHLDRKLLRSGKEDWEEVMLDEDGFVLDPQRLFLASTVERFGGHTYVPSLSGRSSVARLGLFVHLSSDMGNLGAVHAWTLELFSALPLRIYAGMPIVQVSFWKSEGRKAPYEGRYDAFDGATPSKSRELTEQLSP